MHPWVLPQPHEKALNQSRSACLILNQGDSNSLTTLLISCPATIFCLLYLLPPTNCPQTHPEHVTRTARKHSANSTPLAGELCAFPHPFPQLHPLFQGWSQSEQGVCAERTMPVCACEVGTYSRAPSQSTTACATQL